MATDDQKSNGYNLEGDVEELEKELEEFFAQAGVAEAEQEKIRELKPAKKRIVIAQWMSSKVS